jgi:hypothetical protein
LDQLRDSIGFYIDDIKDGCYGDKLRAFAVLSGISLDALAEVISDVSIEIVFAAFIDLELETDDMCLQLMVRLLIIGRLRGNTDPPNFIDYLANVERTNSIEIILDWLSADHGDDVEENALDIYNMYKRVACNEG